MQIPQGVQLPLYEPIYDRNGQLSPVWAMFFETIVQLLNSAKLADLIVLMQLASQLPDQSRSGQAGIDLDQIQNIVNAVNTQHQLSHEAPTATAVFLCPKDLVDPVAVPQIEVISP